MKLADRILMLRKKKGISQEELADKLGVSRQAISKWESEQSTPEIDKIIMMSDFFEVTTDYLLKGIEPINKENEKSRKAGNLISVLAPFMAWAGYIISCALWYEYQNAFALMNGFLWIGLSAALIHAVKMNGMTDRNAADRYWMISIPVITVFLLSILFNAFSSHQAAPYPLTESGSWGLLASSALLAVCIIIAAEVMMKRKSRS